MFGVISILNKKKSKFSMNIDNLDIEKLNKVKSSLNRKKEIYRKYLSGDIQSFFVYRMLECDYSIVNIKIKSLEGVK